MAMRSCLWRCTQLLLAAAIALLAGCSGGPRAAFPTEEEVRAKLHRDMTADQVFAAFGQPAGQQWVDLKLGGKVHYLAPSAARTRGFEGYVGFTVNFNRDRVWDWEIIMMNPSYEHRLLPAGASSWQLRLVGLAALGLLGYGAFRAVRARASRRMALLEAYTRREIPPELPPEFNFITHDTTLQSVIEKAGPASRVTKVPMKRDAVGDGGAEQRTSRETVITAYQYDLPDGGAVIVLPDQPAEPHCRIRAVLNRRPRGAEHI